jgi:short subunit dehydrogenase-like uncharacterized protein
MMALINTRNIHRSNMLTGFPYGRNSVYDEMVLTGPGEKGEANAAGDGREYRKDRSRCAWAPGEGPSKEERENCLYDLLYVAIVWTAARSVHQSRATAIPAMARRQR